MASSPDGQGAGRRLAALRARMVAEDLEALLISRPENRRYLSGFTADDDALTESSGSLLITAQEAFLLTDFRYQEAAAFEAPGFEVRVYTRGLDSLLTEMLAELGCQRLGFESDYLTYAIVQRIIKTLKKVGQEIKVLPTIDLVAELRATKDEGEIEAIEASLSLIEAVLDALIGEIKPGASEQEAAWQVVEALHARGASPAFPPLVASGPNASKPHAVPTDRPIQAGEPIIIDVGAKREGYCSDITRTVCLGRAGAKFQEVYRIVRQAQLAALEGIKPGLKTDAADHLARRIIEEAGFGQAFGHSLGHGVGLAVHETPALSPLKSTVLAPGMVTTIEPAIYLPGWGGVRLEVMLLITETGAKRLGALNRFYDYG